MKRLLGLSNQPCEWWPTCSKPLSYSCGKYLNYHRELAKQTPRVPLGTRGVVSHFSLLVIQLFLYPYVRFVVILTHGWVILFFLFIQHFIFRFLICNGRNQKKFLILLSVRNVSHNPQNSGQFACWAHVLNHIWLVLLFTSSHRFSCYYQQNISKVVELYPCKASSVFLIFCTSQHI